MSSTIFASCRLMKTIYQDDYRKLINYITTIRKAKNLTQLEIAQKLEKPQSYIAKIENFERKLDILEFVQLCQILGVRPSDVIVLIE